MRGTGVTDRRRLVLGTPRELGTVGLVAGLAGAYAAALIMTSSFLTTMSEQGGALGFFLDAVSSVFVLISLYVATVVIVNCVSTVLAGRQRQLALLRLLGATGRDLRRTVRGGTARAGAAGAAIGLLVGTALADLTRVVLVATGRMPGLDYDWASAKLLGAGAAVTLAATLAGWWGSRGVLSVAPAQAMTGVSAPTPARRTSVLRTTLAVVLVGGGVLLLALAALLGEGTSAAGFFTAFLGSTVSGTGLLVGASLVIPRVVAGLGRLVGDGPAARIARRNAVLDPHRTTRSTMGLVLGLTLVTTFAAGTSALRASLDSWELDPAQRAQADQVMAVTATVMICIVVISSVIAAVGFVSTMSLTVIQRHREIGLLRALGFTPAQVRSMVTRESVALSAAAITLGIALGLVYGAIGAQSLVGFQTDGLVWGTPWLVLALIAAAGVLLVLLASRPPARRAVRVTPVEALRDVAS